MPEWNYANWKSLASGRADHLECAMPSDLQASSILPIVNNVSKVG